MTKNQLEMALASQNVLGTDVMDLAEQVVKSKSNSDPFFDNSAILLLSSVLGLVMEYPDEKRNISSICELLGNLETVRKELGKRIASDEAVSWYRSFELCGEKTQGTVASMLIITISNLD